MIRLDDAQIAQVSKVTHPLAGQDRAGHAGLLRGRYRPEDGEPLATFDLRLARQAEQLGVDLAL